MHGTKQFSLQSQRGVSLSGLIVVIGLILVVGMFAMKVFPFVMEYRAAKAAIRVAKQTPGSAMDQRIAFNRAADINSISSVSMKDLIVYKVNGQTEIAFDYETKIPLFTNVYLGVRWVDTTDPSGVIPEAPAAAPQ